jgi:hypothetical protein
MATNCKKIIEAAYARSTSNDPDKLATDKELVGVIDRRLKGLFSMAARFNPHYFGKSMVTAYSAPGWAQPSDMEMLIRVQNAGGAEVNVVPFDDKEAEHAPRVYSFGQIYRTVGGTGDPAVSDALTLFYSRRPVDLDPSQPSDASINVIDPMWPEQFNDLLVLHVAKYLATKDDGRQDIAHLATEEQSLLETFTRHLSHVNYATKARFGHRARMVAPGPEGFRGE